MITIKVDRPFDAIICMYTDVEKVMIIMNNEKSLAWYKVMFDNWYKCKNRLRGDVIQCDDYDSLFCFPIINDTRWENKIR